MKTPRELQREAELAEIYPAGTAIRVTRDDGTTYDTTTRYTPHTWPNGTEGVWVTAHGKDVDLRRVQIIKAGET